VSSLGHYLAEPVLTGSRNWDHVLGTINAEKFGASGLVLLISKSTEPYGVDTGLPGTTCRRVRRDLVT
jgi:hypothetical protein